VGEPAGKTAALHRPPSPAHGEDEGTRRRDFKEMTMSEADGSGRDVDLRAKPDWQAIREDYETSMDSQQKIADRHGITLASLSSRKLRYHWYRRPKARFDAVVMQEAVLDMMQDIRRATSSLLKRGNRLIARSEKEGEKTEMLVALHERNVASVAGLVRSTDRFAKMLERCGMALPAEPHLEIDDDPHTRLENRMDAIAEKIRAAGYPVPPDEE
jgi:hypothetical protein